MAELALFYPQKLTEHDAKLSHLSGVAAEEVYFQASPESPRINGLFYNVPNAKTVVLFDHGNAANLDCRIEKFKASDVFTLHNEFNKMPLKEQLAVTRSMLKAERKEGKEHPDCKILRTAQPAGANTSL